MLYTKHTFAGDAQNKLQQGINLLCQAVGVTLGPKGQLVCINRFGQPPFTTKDGKTVAQEFTLEDIELQAGVLLCRGAANKTCDQAGDGTTATIILTNALVNEGLKAIVAGGNAVAIVAGIKKACALVVEHIKATAQQIDLTDTESKQLEHIATIAANGDEVLGEMIASAYRNVGKDGIVNMGMPLSEVTEVRYSQGLRIEKGYIDEGFCNNHAKKTCRLENPLVLIYEKKVLTPESILQPGASPTPEHPQGLPAKILQQVGKLKRPLLFMCDGLDEISKAT